jgi:2-polyprenyl-3-methyl-5-hydroxy-6-metoxy-1,4-benzoquinol methylase
MNCSVKKNDLPFNCPACNSSVITIGWRTHRINGEKSILWCADCGFGWQHPLPNSEEIRDYYDVCPTYNIHGVDEKEASAIKRIRRIDRLMTYRGRLLDIGSGLGYFLKIAQDDGWSVTGLEPQKSAALFCQNNLGINVIMGGIHNHKFDRESFDVVTLWDVWEHVHDPLQFFDQCISLLAPGGLLVLAVPNASGLPARIFKGQWRYVMKTHLNYFTLSYVNRIFADRGLAIERSDHTIKIQSLLQGFTSWLPFKVDTEKIIRLGRKDSVENGRHEQTRTKSRWEQSPPWKFFLGSVRRIILKLNLAPIPGPYGDLMDLYCRKV